MFGIFGHLGAWEDVLADRMVILADRLRKVADRILFRRIDSSFWRIDPIFWRIGCRSTLIFLMKAGKLDVYLPLNKPI